MRLSPSIRDYSMVLALLGIGIFFSLAAPQFLSARNLSMLMTELSITGTLAMGMLLIILPGHIDLSVGSGVGLIGGLASVLVTHHHLPAPVALAIGLVVAVGLWILMGSLIVRECIPAFIITLGGLLIFKGVFWKIINNTTVSVAPGGTSNLYSLLTTYYLPPWLGLALATVLSGLLFYLAGRSQRQAPARDPELSFLKSFLAAQGLFLFVIIANQFRGIPLPALILAAITAIVYLLTRHTAFGRYLYAIGGNEEAAVISGVPVQRIVITAFGIMGAIVAVTGFMQTAYAGSSTTTVGDLMELDAIAACVIGGVSLRGGRGTVLGVLFGALLMATLLNGMTLLAVPPEYKYITRGLVLSLAVWMDTRLAHQ